MRNREKVQARGTNSPWFEWRRPDWGGAREPLQPTPTGRLQRPTWRLRRSHRTAGRRATGHRAAASHRAGGRIGPPPPVATGAVVDSRVVKVPCHKQDGVGAERRARSMYATLRQKVKRQRGSDSRRRKTYKTATDRMSRMPKKMKPEVTPMRLPPSDRPQAMG